MFSALIKTMDFRDLTWSKIEPYFQELYNRPLDAEGVETWLSNWNQVHELVMEAYQRAYVAATRDTNDEIIQARYRMVIEELLPKSLEGDHRLKVRLIESGLQPANFAIPLRNMRAEVEIFRLDNLPLQTEEMKLSNEYDRIAASQTIQWDGKELTLPQLATVYQETDRARREKAWQASMRRWLADRRALDELWGDFMKLRKSIANNAGLQNFRQYRWRQLLRFDYTPEDCKQFHEAIEAVVVPAAERIYAKRRQQLGLETLRPWDLEVDPHNRPPLRPFHSIAELESKSAAIFQRVDPELGEYFEILRREGLLDLENRKGKAPGAYCTDFAVSRRPFVFANAVGVHDDVQTVLHESGHAFHAFESYQLALSAQRQVTSEMAEVASMSMELLGAPYLTQDEGGFYTRAEAARARIEHLEGLLRFWPYMAVVDAFQHWVYENQDQAADPGQCDAAWTGLWKRFMRGVDWTGMDEALKTGWQRKLHIFQLPFYYVEYGLAQLGAVQVWRNALSNQAQAVAAYRHALSLGGTAPLPELYAAAGARFAFDERMLQAAVGLIEETVKRLEEEAM